MAINAEMDKRTVATIKGLIIDGVSKAASGHPGGAMSSTDFAYLLYQEFLNYDPADGEWFNRDRFVLSAGHESMLLYSLCVMQGFLDAEELKYFRQLGHHTAGHPEVDPKLGIENTSGPLGQGVGMAVGLAIAEELLGAQLGRDIVDHYTYVLAGDGCLQEPVTLGAAQLAGHYQLNKLILFYDNNRIQISGHTHRADSTDIEKMFESFHWRVVTIDGHDHGAIRKAIGDAKEQQDKPTLIIGKTTMSKGSVNYEDIHDYHGQPFPDDEVIAIKKNLGLPEDQTFHIPQDAVDHFRANNEEREKNVAQWKERLQKKLANDSSFKTLWEAFQKESFTGLTTPEFETGTSIATRAAFGKVLESLVDQVPTLAGGSADLEPSNNTAAFYKKVGDFTKENRKGRNFAFGVREFPMGVLINGMSLHGLRSFGATFLVFSDYERGALRLSALMEKPVLHVFTHDSFYLGEDGPTHQPIEHLASLRSMPNMLVMRPGDANETAACMKTALAQSHRPVSLILTRQGLPVLDRSLGIDEGVEKGAYIVHKENGNRPDCIIIATGSEVALAMEAARESDLDIRVVSMPCRELFEEQDIWYQQEVIPPHVEARLVLEAGSTYGWGKYAGLRGKAFGLDSFGASAPAKVLAEEFGFTKENILKLIHEVVKNQ